MHIKCISAKYAIGRQLLLETRYYNSHSESQFMDIIL